MLFACLSPLVSLKELDVDNTSIGDESLRAIATSLTRLTKLNLWDCNSITSEGFACLLSLVSLEELSLRWMEISDTTKAEGFACLSSLRSLALSLIINRILHARAFISCHAFVFCSCLGVSPVVFSTSKIPGIFLPSLFRRLCFFFAPQRQLPTVL